MNALLRASLGGLRQVTVRQVHGIAVGQGILVKKLWINDRCLSAGCRWCCTKESGLRRTIGAHAALSDCITCRGACKLPSAQVTPTTWLTAFIGTMADNSPRCAQHGSR